MIELLRKRRSIRKYTNKGIDKASLDVLIEALLRSPSSLNNRPWEFIIVDKPELLSKLSKAKAHGSQFLEKATLGIVVCADSSKSDVWVEDCSIASILLQLTAESLGLGSCWIQIRKREYNDAKTSEAYIQEILGIPEHINVESIIGIGWPDETKKPVPKSSLDYQKVRHNNYNEHE
ncbi:MAG: nitroreductase family protein [Proteobacteria bacterium]|nr:nitroreductase family protein [Pseudomonadota bacterium]